MSPSADRPDFQTANEPNGHTAATFRQSELPDLDLDELSPLPPAQGVSNHKSASIEQLSSLDRNAASQNSIPHVASPSPALSAAPSSFHLEGSPPSSPAPTGTSVRVPPLAERTNVNDTGRLEQHQELSDKTQPQRQHAEDDVKQRPQPQPQQQDPNSTLQAPPSARYVTVSAILSRSEMYYAPETSDHWDILRSPQRMPADAQYPSHSDSWPSGSSEPFAYLRKRKSQRKRPSNGSAIEALGALLLRKDSSGRVASLSFARTDDVDSMSKDRDPKSIDAADNKRKSASKHSVQTWTTALGSLGKRGLSLQLPHLPPAKASLSTKGATIAERRAQMWHKVLTRQGAVVEAKHDGFLKVRSRRGGLSFEVGTSSRKQTPSTLLELNNYRPSGKGKETEYKLVEEDSNEGHSRHPDAIAEAAQSLQSGRASNFEHRLPDTIVLTAGRRPRLTQISKSEFGIGSAYHDQDLPEAPPSPVAMPGAWHGGSSWRSKPGDGYEEGALLLPPPLLDDHGSDASSFEGLLGVRRMREREKARKQAERLTARNRPAHKVGPLTALTNFVKAAHAAETSAKRARGAGLFGQAPAFLRSQTEPNPARARSSSVGSSYGQAMATSPIANIANSSIAQVSGGADRPNDGDNGVVLQPLDTELLSAAPADFDSEARKSPAVNSISPFLSPAVRKVALSRRGSRTNSIDATGRQLNTVFEFEPLDPAQIPDDQLASPDLPPISSPLLRPSSSGSSKASAYRDFPSAPRLLPVQLSVPPSPFTPLAIDQQRDARGSMVPSTAINGDYLSARVLHLPPRAPQLAPTMLSLPPSPWTPYQDSSVVHAPPMVHLHLNTSSSSLRRAPGTPRLVPTHLEILPSPFPTSAASRRGSLTFDSPHGLRAIGTARSPLTGATTEFTAFAALKGPRSAEHGAMSATELVMNGSTDATPSATSAPGNGTQRLTPSSMLVAAQSLQADEATGVSAMHSNSDEISEVNPSPASGRQARRRSSQGTVHVDSLGRQRNFLLWFLIGDLGLRNCGQNAASQAEVSSSKGTEADHGGVIAILGHIIGLFVFIAAHLVDLTYSIYEKVSMVLWFLRWMVYNLTGRTVLAQCIIEAYGFIQAEWATVAMEDHEKKGSKKRIDKEGQKKPKGLSRWQVLRGLLELYCLHSVTRDRYLADGAGLRRLEGWRRQSKHERPGRGPNPNGSDRVDIGAHRAASRAAFGEKRRSWAQKDSTIAALNADDGDSDHGAGANALANGDSRTSHATEIDGRNSTDYHDGEGHGESDDYGDEADDSSDDEMIVTNRGDDILEFAKTPRLDAARPGQPSSGYFGRAYDFMTSPQVGASQPQSVKRDPRPFEETNRDLVRTIKWCGRLAISAYGLHVHIVDLPPTFTPSGDRFSRQTFAYLSRLNADDVLHADIQTLDADADYSPTFYIVRDYVRKVVCVAVRGTQSFSDIIVDLDLQTEEIELPQVQPTPGEEFRCHAGIWRAAKALVSPQSKLFATLRQALAENEGFGVMFCGHSLGGAIASAAALLLAEYFIPDGAEPDSGTWVTNMSSGLPARRPIRAVSFASPVTMTSDLAARAALGSVPLVTTVVLGSDVIPRVGHGQVRELRRVLGALSRVRRRHELASSDRQDDARVHILRSYWDWRSIKMAKSADEVMLHRKERIEEQLWSLRREVESDLYAAIKARLDAESTAGARIPPSPWVGPQQREAAPLHALATRRQELDTATLRSEAAAGGPLIPPGRCIWINNKQIYHVESPLAFFSLPELRSDMFAAHFPAAYEEAILELRT